MKYRVVLGWKENYIFEDATTAISFAEVALTHGEGPKNIRIEVKTDEQFEEEQNDAD